MSKPSGLVGNGMKNLPDLGYRLTHSRNCRNWHVQCRTSVKTGKLVHRIAKHHCMGNISEAIRLAIDMLGVQLGYLKPNECTKSRARLRWLEENKRIRTKRAKLEDLQ